jgi:hypothetical protein
MLNHVERRRLLVKPPGEDPLPFLVRLLDVELNEGAGQLLFLPRRARLTGAQTNNHVLPSDRLPGMKRDVLDDSVALVEDAKCGRPLRHGRYAALSLGG